MFDSLTAASVFIAYRRADSGEWAGDLRTALQALGHDVFFDLTYLRASDRWRAVINEALDQCDVAVVVIGPEWATITDREGRRRIDDPTDVHRHEVARALSRDDVAVVPVLVDGARMPDAGDLPEDVRAITEFQAVELRATAWDGGVRQVHEVVEQQVRRRWSAWAEAIVVGGLVAVPAGLFTGLAFVDTTVPDAAGERLLRLGIQRGVAWGLILAAVLGWSMWRRGRRHAWVAGLRVGAVYGALCGVAGALVHGLGSYWIAEDKIHVAFLEAAAHDTVKAVSLAASTAVTAAAIGALLGAVFTPSGVRRGLLAGLASGAALGLAGRTQYLIDHATTRWVVFAVGIVGAVVAVEYVTRAFTYGRGPSRIARVPGVRVAS